MDTKEIEILISDFDSTAGKVKTALEGTMSCVSEGRIPRNIQIIELNEQLDKMKEEYLFIKSRAEELSGTTFEEDLDIPVTEFKTIIENSEVQKIREKLLQAETTLNTFIRIKSVVDGYAKALQPMQKEASEVIIGHNDGIIDDERFIDATKLPALFVEAVLIEDIDSDRGIDLVDLIGEHFPKRVMAGVAAGKYYISDDLQKIKATFDEFSVSCSEKVVDEEITSTFQMIEEENVQELVVDEDSCEEMEAKAVAIEEVVERTKSDEVIFSCNKPKSCTANASSFKSEIRGLPNAIGNVLPLFTSLGALTETQIYRYGICMDCYTSEATEPREKLPNIIERLMSKGWLAAYEIDEEGTKAYCLSKYVYGCLGKSSIRSLQKIWGISFGKLEFYGEEQISKQILCNFIEANERMLIYLEGVRKLLDIETYRRIRASIKWENEHFVVRIIDEGSEKTSVLMNSLDEKAKAEDEIVLYVVKTNETEAQVKQFNKNTYLFVNGKMCNDGKSRSLNEEKTFDEYEKVEPALEKIVESIKVIDEPLKKIADSEVDGELESLEDEMEALSDVHSSMTDHELCAYVRILLNRYYDTEEERITAVSNAVLLAKASSLEAKWEESKELYNQLLYATAIPLDEFQHTSTTIPEIFQNNSPEALKLCAQMYSMLVPGSSYGNVRDYTLKSMNETSLRDYEQQFPSCSSYKELFSKLTGIGAIAPSGYTTSIIARLGDDAENQAYISSLGRQAKVLQTLPNIKTRMKTLPTMYNSCFGKNSELYECMSIITENRVTEREFVEAILEDYCENVAGEFKISSDKIEKKLDAEWAAANPGNPFTLDFDARGQAIRQFLNRLNLMKLWYEHTDNSTEKGTDLSKLKTMRDDIIELCEKALATFNETELEYSNVVYWMIKYIKDYISGEFDAQTIYKSVLYTGRLSLDDKYMPCLDATLAGITYCEPWRSVIAHIETEVLPIEEVIDAISDKDSLMFDNLNQLSFIGRCIKEKKDECRVAENREKDALRAADVRTKKFKERLELAYTYDQISEVEKETLAGIMERQQIRFYGIRDYGCWRQFLDGLERQIIEIAIERKRSLRKKIDSRRSANPDSVILKEALVLLERDTNLAVAEEYLNRFDAGETELSIDMESFVKPRNEFTTFLSEDVYDFILNAAKRKTQKTMKEWGWDFVSGKLPADWTKRLKEDSQKIIYNWPAGRVQSTSDNAIRNACSAIEILFKGLGFDVKSVTLQKGTREETYMMELSQTPRSLADYPHPIAAFGTQIKPRMKVMVLYGNHTPGQIVEAVSMADNKGFSVVLLDRPLEKVARRQVGELSHQKSGQNPFLLIDWVLLLHLAMHENTKRLPLLLTCTLPYTTYQPFVWDGGSTADEMFCGRTKELNDIMNPSGACVVYGGRQLGKTALLERAESRCHRPDNKEYAVFCSIIKKTTEKEVAELVVEKINVKTGLGLKNCTTLKEVCSQLEAFINNGQIVAFFLFLDECDDFLGSISDNAYQQLQPMIDLKRSSKNAFKFVLAGLHNVCRAKNSTERNGVFGQLGQPLCVKPLAPTDALQLLVKPLNYLGFQINLNPHLNTILTKTNYYPGILQFFGYKLLETLTDQYSKYYSAANGNPPFSLKEEQLGAVLSSADLNNSIKEKFRWSLELDQRYFMICRCITMLYHFDAEDQNSNWKGFSAEQIREMADTYDVHCLKKASNSEYINLLDEMVDMGILSKLEGDTYRLRRNSFVDIIGSDMDALERDIIENNVEVAS